MDCGETPRPRGSNLPKLQEPRDSEICLAFNQDVCAGSRATRPTSSVNGNIDVQSNGCSDKNHQRSLENEHKPTSSVNGDIDAQCNGYIKNSQHSLEIEHSDNAAGKFFSDLPELQGLCDSRIDLNSNQESCVGGQGDKHTRIGNDQENGVMAAGKTLLPLNPQSIRWKEWTIDRRDKQLLLPNLSWEEKVLFTLNMVRRREIFEYNPKKYNIVPTRFCEFNIALFDLDKESDFKREPRFSKIPDSFRDLDSSINIISIKVSESDVPFPINIYGTVLARDQVDYRCVYLFNRGRDNPQCITSVDDTLTLTGPYRALAGLDIIVFEFNLKIIKGDKEAIEFSKGLIQRGSITSELRLLTSSLGSCLSKVKMEFYNVPYALEASIEVNILNEKSYFHGKITAGLCKKNGILLYDSKVAGTETRLGCGGSVSLTRRVVAVPWGRDLVLHFSVPRAKPKSISLEHDEEERTFKLGTCVLQVKISWTGVLTKQRKNVVKEIDRALVLL